MIEPHVHCGECFNAISLLPPEPEDGVTYAQVKIHTGQQAFVVPGPNGTAGIGMREVPICDECAERLTQAARKPKLVVPSPKFG